MSNKHGLIVILTTLLIISACSPSIKKPDEPIMSANEENSELTEKMTLSTATDSRFSSVTVTPPSVIATSRGDKLVATDPTSVNLVAGIPTLVEFFRFT